MDSRLYFLTCQADESHHEIIMGGGWGDDMLFLMPVWILQAHLTEPITRTWHWRIREDSGETIGSRRKLNGKIVGEWPPK